MTLTQLQYALAVYTHQHFGKAAEACHVTQPTLSMQIQKLEEELGIVLFNREKHPVRATEAGEPILIQAQRVLDESGRIGELVQEMKGDLTGEFRLGVIPTLAPQMIYRLAPKLREHLPDVRFKIRELQTEQIIEAIRSRELDAALLATPLDERLIQEEPLFYEPFMAFVPEDHRLAQEAFVLHSELVLDDLLLLDEGHCFRNSVLKLCGERTEIGSRGSGSIELETGNFDSLIRLAKQGHGMTLLPYLTAADLPKDDQKLLKPLDHPIPTREISLVFHRSNFRHRMIEKIGRSVRESVPPRLHEEKHRPIAPL